MPGVQRISHRLLESVIDNPYEVPDELAVESEPPVDRFLPICFGINFGLALLLTGWCVYAIQSADQIPPPDSDYQRMFSWIILWFAIPYAACEWLAFSFAYRPPKKRLLPLSNLFLAVLCGWGTLSFLIGPPVNPLTIIVYGAITIWLTVSGVYRMKHDTGWE